jgi:hypothetical protein
MTDPYGGTDMARVMYGQNARHVPAWMYVQRHSAETAGLIGASRVPQGTAHPLLYGSARQHAFIVGEVIVRPHLVITTDALAGTGAGSLYLGDHDFRAMLADGELAVGSEVTLNRARRQWEG